MKVLIVLGNRMNDDGSLSDKMLVRLKLAEERYAQGDIDAVIVSGGLANPAAGSTEASVMKRELVLRGIPEDKITEEDRSLTTAQNAEYSVPLARSMGADVVVLCSSREHICRWYLNPARLFLRRMRKAGYTPKALEICADR